MLLRPDGHVAWIGEDQPGLRGRMSTWFGDPSDENRPLKHDPGR